MVPDGLVDLDDPVDLGIPVVLGIQDALGGLDSRVVLGNLLIRVGQLDRLDRLYLDHLPSQWLRLDQWHQLHQLYLVVPVGQ